MLSSTYSFIHFLALQALVQGLALSCTHHRDILRPEQDEVFFRVDERNAAETPLQPHVPSPPKKRTHFRKSGDAQAHLQKPVHPLTKLKGFSVTAHASAE